MSEGARDSPRRDAITEPVWEPRMRSLGSWMPKTHKGIEPLASLEQKIKHNPRKKCVEGPYLSVLATLRAEMAWGVWEAGAQTPQGDRTLATSTAAGQVDEEPGKLIT